jgi:hypothetical protein
VAETTVKTLQYCWFRRTGKAMGQVYHWWWRIYREINVFFSRFEYHMFCVLYPFVAYLLTLPRILYAKHSPAFFETVQRIGCYAFFRTFIFVISWTRSQFKKIKIKENLYWV